VTATAESVETARVLPGAVTGRRDRWWRSRRMQVALGLWLAVVLTMTFRWGLPTSRTNLFLVLGLGLVAFGVGRPADLGRLVRDWAPLFLLLTAYDALRSHADDWGIVHVLPQIRADRWLFGGQVPTVALQHALFTPGSPNWWDYASFFVYLSYFFVPLVAAALLWKFAYARFHRYALLFVTLCFSAFVTYALFPAAPPWLASQTTHSLAPTAKIVDEVWVHLGLHQGATMLSARGHLANPVAAIPSLHSAVAFFIVLFFWRSAGRWRGLLALYPLAMGFALVYMGEHYVTDVLLGWIYATVVFVAGNALYDWLSERRAIAAVAREQTISA
jgi:membrane-associated phospholipid phosphatase